MNRGKSLIVIVSCSILFLFFCNCTDASRYSGDGRLIDNGLFAATDRYVLDLGVVELKKKGIYTYKINNLPSKNFVIGIEIRVSPEQHATIENKKIRPLISIELTNSQNIQVIHNEASLDTWTWSVIGDTAFVYGEDQSSTYFTPISNGKYNLRFVIINTDSSDIKYVARILAKSGGWK